MYVFSFDVESMGLHGIGFAVGWVVLTVDDGELVEEVGVGYLGFDPEVLKPRVDADTVSWLEKNVLPVLEYYNCATLTDMHAAFWGELQLWKKRGALIVADCSWPVEANFLSRCMSLSKVEPFDGPHPLHEVATMLLAAGMDPLGEYERFENELPKHHPTADARQSARMFVTAMQKVKR